VKPDIHPNYGKVLFVDTASKTEWVCRSTMTSKETREVDGEEIPVVNHEFSSFSHPVWTGKMRELDADGKIDRFRRRYGGKAKTDDTPKAEEE
jgi:large subunit ribosomal protein L31